MMERMEKESYNKSGGGSDDYFGELLGSMDMLWLDEVTDCGLQDKFFYI